MELPEYFKVIKESRMFLKSRCINEELFTTENDKYLSLYKLQQSTNDYKGGFVNTKEYIESLNEYKNIPLKVKITKKIDTESLKFNPKLTIYHLIDGKYYKELFKDEDSYAINYYPLRNECVNIEKINELHKIIAEYYPEYFV